jgi:AraC family transcriptional regulator
MTPFIGRSDTGASRSILSPLFLGPATLLQSSAPLNWGGVLVEKYVCRPGERGAGNVLDAPVLAMLCSPAWRGEHVAADGTFASHSKTVGALTVVPSGPLPAARSLRQCDLLYCAFDHSLVSEVRNEIEGEVPPSLGLRSCVRDHAISEILNLFESRLEADLTLQELAAVGYSRSHFLRAFRATTGLTPHRYLLNRRIERARRLLGEPDMRIAQVAYCCGFSSQAHFTLAFRKVCGLTPGEYRREL